MIKRMLIAGGLMLASLGAVVAPAVAQPYTAFVATGLNLRSGPGTEYPPVVVLSAGTPVTVHGCLEGWTWCDVTVGEYRGWVSGRYLTYEQLGHRVPVVQVAPTIGLPVLTFSLGNYWDSYYRGRPWYRDRDRWVTHYHHRPTYSGYRPPAVNYYRPPSYRWRDDRPYNRPVYNAPRRDYDRDRRDWDRGRNDWNRGDRGRNDWNRGDNRVHRDPPPRPRNESYRPETRSERYSRERNASERQRLGRTPGE